MTHTEPTDDQGGTKEGEEASFQKDVEERLNRLETLVVEQQQIIENQNKRLSNIFGSDGSGDRSKDDASRLPVTRRGALTAGGLVALLGLGTTSTSAQQGNPGGVVYNWDQDVDADGNSLTELGSLVMADNETKITDFAGSHLSIVDGKLQASGPLWNDSDEDHLLEPETTFEGIDVDIVDTDHLDVSNTGVDVWLSSGQEIPARTDTTILFDQVSTDHFGGYDTTSGVYTIPADGDYHATFQISWSTGFSDPTEVHYMLKVNGDRERGIIAHPASHRGRPAKSVSKTLFGLSGGDRITVEVYIDTPDSRFVLGNPNFENTFMTLHKIG